MKSRFDECGYVMYQHGSDLEKHLYLTHLTASFTGSDYFGNKLVTDGSFSGRRASYSAISGRTGASGPKGRPTAFLGPLRRRRSGSALFTPSAEGAAAPDRSTPGSGSTRSQQERGHQREVLSRCYGLTSKESRLSEPLKGLPQHPRQQGNASMSTGDREELAPRRI